MTLEDEHVKILYHLCGFCLRCCKLGLRTAVYKAHGQHIIVAEEDCCDGRYGPWRSARSER